MSQLPLEGRTRANSKVGPAYINYYWPHLSILYPTESEFAKFFFPPLPTKIAQTWVSTCLLPPLLQRWSDENRLSLLPSLLSRRILLVRSPFRRRFLVSGWGLWFLDETSWQEGPTRLQWQNQSKFSFVPRSYAVQTITKLIFPTSKV